MTYTYNVICTTPEGERTFTYTDCTDAIDALRKFMVDQPDYYDDRDFRIQRV